MQSPRFIFNRSFFENPKEYGDLKLFQIGRRYCKENEIISAHTHQNNYELTIVTGGEGTVSTNGASYPLKSGDIHLSIPCDIHEIKASSSSKLEYDYFSFEYKDGEFNNELKKISTKLFDTGSRVFVNPKISNLVGNAISEFSSEKPYSFEILKNIFNQIAIYVIRDFSNVKDGRGKFTENEILCYQVMNYVDTHIYSIINLENIAPKFNYNYSYLSSLFKKTTGKTLFDYFQSRKLETAKVLILEKRYKISEIAEILNYSSPFAFSKAFKLKYGVSPKNLQSTAN